VQRSLEASVQGRIGVGLAEAVAVRDRLAAALARLQVEVGAATTDLAGA